MEIRLEKPADFTEIHKLTCAAFETKGEAILIDHLRADGDLALSFVATQNDNIIGHIALSWLQSPAKTLALAPLSVLPKHQKQGIGGALIKACIYEAKKLGAEIIFVLGDPAYYTRFGFSVEVAAPFPCPYAGPYFMGLWLIGPHDKTATVTYANAFDTLE